MFYVWNEVFMKSMRKCGILLHPTSLPGSDGIGSLGKAAYSFVEFLADAGQSFWQILPLGPTGYGNSPYSCYSAFAGNPLMIDLTTLVEEGDLDPHEVRHDLQEGRVDFPFVEQYKIPLLRRAAANFFAGAAQVRRDEFWHFCDATFWLHDFALFGALKGHFPGKTWCRWPAQLVRRHPETIATYSRELGTGIGEQKYMQWQFHRQWHRLKAFANSRGIKIIGDMPIFVAFDSVDVWANQHLFFLDEGGKPTVVAGVPPDYFSKTGQLWGNPLYDWQRMADEGFSWWIARVRNDLAWYDMVRIDHFRGFEGYWEVPAAEKTAIRGRWVKGPGERFFKAVEENLGSLPFIAEDLGVITPEVEALRDSFRFPGMKILQFAFGSDSGNPYLPHNHVRECVVYTGTHDNDTTYGWFSSLQGREKKRACEYLHITEEEGAWGLVRAALSSVADMAVIPLQDVLQLDSSARMNVPGSSRGNWTWRFRRGDACAELATKLRETTALYGRCEPADVFHGKLA